jgi:septum formation protein
MDISLLSLQKPLQAALEAGALRIVLASASPRRLEALAVMLGIPNGIQVVTSTFHEELPHADYRSAQEYSMATAREKALDVCNKLQASSTRTIVIAADTIVELQGQILEKPADAADAKRMLAMLSGNEHQVHSSVLLYELPGTVEIFAFTTTTSVKFASLTETEIAAYVASGEPLDKAGAYGIQGVGRTLVEAIRGDFFNVVGFPSRDFAARFAAYLQPLLQQTPHHSSSR